jgi:glycosyltransferase 2 family protein
MSNVSGKLKRLHPWIAVAAFALAAFLVYRALQQYSMSEVLESLKAISLRHLALGAAFTVGSFVCLTGSDTLAVRYTGSDLPYRKIALASFTSLSLGHTLGLAALSSGAVRYRFYTGWGLSPGDVGRIILFCAMTVAVGLATAGGIASLVQPALVAQMFKVTSAVVVAVGVLLLSVVVTYLGLAAFVHRPIRIRHFELPVPRLSLALGQVAVGTTDFLLVSAVLHQMLSATAEIGYFPVAATYVAANAAAIITHVPGGLGVIEAIILSLVPGANVIGALVAFRAIYYLVPFLIGCVVLALAEIVRRQRRPVAEPRPSSST